MTEAEERRHHELLYSCDDRVALCSMIVALESQLAERTAPRIRRMVSRTVGHDECGACGVTVGPYDNYCPHCGTKLGEVVNHDRDR